MSPRYGQLPRSGFEDSLDHMERPAWHVHAACRGRNDWFKIDLGNHRSVATNPEIAERVETCQGCDVRQQCAELAVSQDRTGLVVGVWAGIWTGSRNAKSRRQLAALAGVA